MKRIIVIFSILAIGLFNVLPMKVSAADASGSYSTIYGTINWEWEYTSTSDGIKKWTFYLTPSSSTNYVYYNIVATGVEYDAGAELSTQLNVLGISETSTGNSILLAGTFTAGTKVELFEIETTDTASSGCELNLEAIKLSCVAIDDNYFDVNGNYTTDEEEYEESCGNTTTTTPSDGNDVPNKDTGSYVPYFAIGGGLIAAAGVYLYSKKSRKIYKL